MANVCFLTMSPFYSLSIGRLYFKHCKMLATLVGLYLIVSKKSDQIRGKIYFMGCVKKKNPLIPLSDYLNSSMAF